MDGDSMDDHFWNEVRRSQQLTAAERMTLGLNMCDHCCDYITRRIRETFPDATNEQVSEMRRTVLRRCERWGIN